MRGKAAFTLIEVILSLLILGVVMIGGTFYFFHASSQIRMSRRARLALELAEERMEGLKAVGFSGLASEIENVPMGDFAAARRTEVVGIDDDGDGLEDYRRVTVIVSWREGIAYQDVSLTTFIAPR